MCVFACVCSRARFWIQLTFYIKVHDRIIQQLFIFKRPEVCSSHRHGIWKSPGASMYVHLNIYSYTHKYIHTCIYMHIHIHICIYIHRERERESKKKKDWERERERLDDPKSRLRRELHFCDETHGIIKIRRKRKNLGQKTYSRVWFVTKYADNNPLQISRGSEERWGAGVETQKNVRGEIGGWGRVPFNEPYAPLLSTIYDGA